MEELIRYLPGIFIFLFLIKKLIEYIKLDLESSVPDQSDQKMSENAELNQEISEEKVKEMIEEQVSDEFKKDKELKNRGKEETLEEKSVSVENKIKNKGISLKNKRDRKKSISSNQLQKLLGSNLNKKEITRGMIYKQILDKPRAKKPFEFFS
ncbi:MAG: hypothetical protein ACOC4G_01760 [Bacillota bacterium]